MLLLIDSGVYLHATTTNQCLCLCVCPLRLLHVSKRHCWIKLFFLFNSNLCIIPISLIVLKHRIAHVVVICSIKFWAALLCWAHLTDVCLWCTRSSWANRASVQLPAVSPNHRCLKGPTRGGDLTQSSGSLSAIVMITKQSADHINKRKGPTDAAEMISDNERSSFAIIKFQLSAIVNSQEAIESKAQKVPSSFLHLLNPLTAPAFRYHSLSTFQLAYLRGWEVWTDGGGLDEVWRG